MDSQISNLFDLEILAKTIYGEASGEPWIGKIAVGWTAKNRLAAESWFGKSIHEICLKPFQYSCWNDGPLQIRIAELKWDTTYTHACLGAAFMVLLELTSDPTSGATHYHRAGDTPAWAAGQTPTIQIGQHLFYKDIP